MQQATVNQKYGKMQIHNESTKETQHATINQKYRKMQT